MKLHWCIRIFFLGLILPAVLFSFTPSLSKAHFEHQITATATIGNIPYMYVAHGEHGDWLPYFSKMATKTVAKSTTWSAFSRINSITKNDVILIPEGVTLLIDGATPQFHTLIVEGSLTFSTNKHSELRVGTLVVYPTGNLTIRTPSREVRTSVILGGYDPYDPAQFTVGLIALGGKVDIEGATLPGISYSEVSVAAGSSVVEVQSNFKPKIGDELVFSDSQTTDASHWSYSHYDLSLVTALPQQWETRKVVAVRGNTVSLDRALEYSHEDYAANLTRNVTIGSQNADKRAHVMLVGDTKVSIRNARFMDLGRTDALQVIDNTTFDERGNVTHQGKNNEARYALHLHHVRNPFIVEGNVVTGSPVERKLNNTIERAINGSPRWGIVNHDSFGDVKNNVVVGVAGSGIVGEDGTETGNVTGNIVIGTGQGTGGGDDGRFAPEKGNDLAYGGFGYWFRGPFLKVENNIATGYFKQGGFGYFLHPLFSESQLPTVAGMPAEYKGKNINVNSRGILSFKNNKAVGLFGDAGFVMFYTSVPHSISDFTVVNRNTQGRGLDVEYTRRLEIANSNIQGSGGVALWTNKETKEIVAPRTTFTGFEKMENPK